MIPEYLDCESFEKKYPRYFRLKLLSEVQTPVGKQPVYMFEIRDFSLEEKPLPCVGLFAGVHGLEVIGVKILMAFLEHILEQSVWNSQVQSLLMRIKIVGIPVVNPYGYLKGTRSNGRGVDLMRNAPVESRVSVPFLGGHTLSPVLPYFQGHGHFEKETATVIKTVEEELFSAPFSLSLDLHSGFGTQDSLWTPYAKQKGYPPQWERFLAVKRTLDETLKHHIYAFEPQSVQYCTKGDLWDYLFDKHCKNPNKEKIFLPLTLEVGSWAWLRKSPLTVFRIKNFFNPVHLHREKRVLRRHLPLLNLLLHVAADYDKIFPQDGKSLPNFEKVPACI